MHIASHGVVSRSLYASFCGVDYAAYPTKCGDLVIARRSDRKTVYLQGDDARNTETELEKACDAVGEDDAVEVIDDVLEQYEAIEEWDDFETTRCAPSSDLMLLNYYGER